MSIYGNENLLHKLFYHPVTVIRYVMESKRKTENGGVK